MGLELFTSSSSISDRVKENKATSAPEIKAEQINRNNISTKPATIFISIVKNRAIKLGGSGSNTLWFN